MEFIKFIFSSAWVWFGSMVFMFVFFQLLTNAIKEYQRGAMFLKHGYRGKPKERTNETRTNE